MARHAGFAATLALGRPAMQRLVNTLYAANKVPHVIPVHQVVPWPGGSLVVDGDLFCGIPQIQFLAAAGGQFSIELRCWGSLRFAFPQEFWEGPFEITGTALITPALALEPTVVSDGPQGGLINVVALQLGLDAPTAQVTGVVIRPLRDRQPSPDVQTVLNTPTLPALLTAAVRALLADQATASIPLRFLGGLQLSPAITAAFRIVDDAFLIGIDVAWPTTVTFGIVSVYPTPPVTSHGNAADLTDFRAGHDLAFALHPAQIPMYFAQALAGLKAQLPDSVTIVSLDISAHAGFLRVVANATVHPAGVHLADARLSFDLIPELTTEPLFTWREKVTARLENVDVDVSLTALGTFLDVLAGLLTVGVGSLGVAGIVDALRGGVVHQILSQGVDISSGTDNARNQQITLTGTTKPLIDVRIQTLQVDRDGLFSTTSVRPRLGRTRISGSSRITGAPPVTVQVHYACTFPLDLLPSDPQLRIAWTLRRLDRNVAVDSQDGWASDMRSYRADIRIDGAAPGLSMALSCRVYRVLGANTENLFTKTVTLQSEDRLQHDHPYVHWGGVVPLPAYIKRADGSLHRNGIASVDRVSKIHRTDLPTRCLFADAYGPVISPRGPSYFDQLPFDPRLLASNRDKVCDYCFFGGPDKTSPLP
jgi:hypothetical protein